MRRAFGVAVVLMLILSIQAAYAGAGDYDLFIDNVKLRPGVKCDIHLKVFVNEEQPRFGKTVFAIPGWAHAAESWDQYAEALFAHPFRGVATSRVVAINLPGHGQSSPPSKISFGELLLDDYVTAILATLDRLQHHGIRPQEIMGFSQGGLLVQMVQQRLVDSGSSLFEEYGIFRAVLLAPTAGWPIAQGCTCEPGDVCFMFYLWFVADGPAYEELGFHFDVPADAYLWMYYANWDGVVSPDAPPLEQLETYRAPAPLFAGMQLAGYAGHVPGYPGPQPFFPPAPVSAGIFGLQSGTLLHVVSFEDDTQCPPSFVEQVFDHLIGSPWWSRYTLVEAEGLLHDRVHMLPVTNPAVIIEAMSEHGWFVW